MLKSTLIEVWTELTPLGRLFVGGISLFLSVCTACSCFSTVLVVLLPVPTPTLQATATLTCSPTSTDQPSFTPLPSPSLTLLPTWGYASETPAIHLVTPTKTLNPAPFPSVTPTFTRIPRNKSPCSCAYDIYDCPYFLKQKQAQACFDFCFRLGKGDIHKLDGDGNGLACDSLP